jgi:hypothetical protein
MLLLSENAADIRRGQGMVLDSAAMSATGMLTFRAVTCTRNNYGTSSLKKRGLAKSSCKVNAWHFLLFIGCVVLCCLGYHEIRHMQAEVVGRPATPRWRLLQQC